MLFCLRDGSLYSVRPRMLISACTDARVGNRTVVKVFGPLKAFLLDAAVGTFSLETELSPDLEADFFPAAFFSADFSRFSILLRMSTKGEGMMCSWWLWIENGTTDAPPTWLVVEFTVEPVLSR